MSGEDWQPGDQAQVVERADLRRNDGAIARGGRMLRPGAIYHVQAVLTAMSGGDLLLELGLRSGPKLARRFRKIRPKRTSEVAERRAPVGREVMA